MENNFELNGLLVKYVKAQEEEDKWKKEKALLKEQILSLMGDEKKYDSGFATASIQLAEGFKYTDEVAMINFLEQNGYQNYVIKTVDTALNKRLKESVESLEGLKPYYTKTLTEKLSVSRDK